MIDCWSVTLQKTAVIFSNTVVHLRLLWICAVYCNLKKNWNKPNKTLIRNYCNLVWICGMINLRSGWIKVIFDLGLWRWELKLMAERNLKVHWFWCVRKPTKSRLNTPCKQIQPLSRINTSVKSVRYEREKFICAPSGTSFIFIIIVIVIIASHIYIVHTTPPQRQPTDQRYSSACHINVPSTWQLSWAFRHHLHSDAVSSQIHPWTEIRQSPRQKSCGREMTGDLNLKKNSRRMAEYFGVNVNCCM